MPPALKPSSIDHETDLAAFRGPAHSTMDPESLDDPSLPNLTFMTLPTKDPQTYGHIHTNPYLEAFIPFPYTPDLP